MNFLLDTNVLSELRKSRPHGAVLEWFRAQPRGAFAISSITLYELQAGVEATRRQDAEKAAEIEHWIDRISLIARVLPLNDTAAREAARMMHARSQDLLEDAYIAATAKVNGLTIATRNTKDFVNFNVRLINPFLPKAL